MQKYKDVEMINVTRWNESIEAWQLTVTNIPVGSIDEHRFFRVIIPHEGGRKIFFDSPSAYMEYSRVSDHGDCSQEAKELALADAVCAWNNRNHSG